MKQAARIIKEVKKAVIGKDDILIKVMEVMDKLSMIWRRSRSKPTRIRTSLFGKMLIQVRPENSVSIQS